MPFFQSILKNLRCAFFIVYVLPPEARAGAIATGARRWPRDALQHLIAERLPLARIADAHELVESGKAVGNVVVDIG